MKNPFISIIGELLPYDHHNIIKPKVNDFIEKFLFIYSEQKHYGYHLKEWEIIEELYKEKYDKIILQLFDIKEREIELNSDANEIYRQFLNKNTSKANESVNIPIGFYEAFESYFLRFALIIEVLNNVSNNKPIGKVSEGSAILAWRLVDYFENQLERAIPLLKLNSYERQKTSNLRAKKAPGRKKEKKARGIG